jgi:signal transduction histidine kinase
MWPYTETEQDWLTPEPQAVASAGRTDLAALCEELRQPLTSIRSMAEILRDNPSLAPEQRARMLSLIVADSVRLDRLIGASLESSRASS